MNGSTLQRMSRRLYRLLLLTYPAPFRDKYGREMEQVFDDLLLAAAHRQGVIGVMRIWFRIIVDLIGTAFTERLHAMQHRKSTILATAFLLPSLVFAFINITKYNLGISIFYDVIAPLYPTATPGLAGNLTTLIIASGPVLGFLLAIQSVLDLQVARDEGGLVGTVRVKPIFVPLMIVGGSLVVGTIFSLYLFVENFGPL